jgi:hypothetical protein
LHSHASTGLHPSPLVERREKLRSLLPMDQRFPIQFSDHWDGSGAALFQKAWAMGLEGIVSKRVLSPYKSGPSKFWLYGGNESGGVIQWRWQAEPRTKKPTRNQKARTIQCPLDIY